MQLDQVSCLITQKLKRMAEATDPNPIRSKRKAISALFPYMVYLARDGQPEMADAFLHVARASNSTHQEFVWSRVGPYITPLFGKPTPPSLNSVIILASSYAPWSRKLVDQITVTGWAAVVLQVSYTEEVGQSVVDVLFRIASSKSLRPHIPIGIWAWLEKRPSLPPQCWGRSWGTAGGIVRHVRAFGDIELLRSYLLLVWSEWDHIDDKSGGFAEMQMLIRKEFGGIGMERHREDLIKRLDHVLGRLDLGFEYLREHKPGLSWDHLERTKKQYGELKTTLLEVDREATNTVTRTSLVDPFWSVDTHGHTESHSTFMCALPLPIL